MALVPAEPTSGGSSATPGVSNGQSDSFHLYGLFAVIAGLATILLVLLILLLVNNLKVADITQVLGVILSPVVAIVSAYFGIAVSASAQSKVQAAGAAALNNQKDSSDKALAAQKDSSDKALAAQKDSSDKALAAGLLASPSDTEARGTLNALVSRLVPDQAGSSQ